MPQKSPKPCHPSSFRGRTKGLGWWDRLHAEEPFPRFFGPLGLRMAVLRHHPLKGDGFNPLSRKREELERGWVRIHHFRLHWYQGDLD